MYDIDNLLNKHRENRVYKSQLINFIGCPGYDVYNISSAFVYKNKQYIFGRVEKPDSEISKVALFEKLETYVYKKTSVEILDLQDPCISIIDDDFLLSGTKIYHNDNEIYSWATAFYRGKTLDELKYFFESPKKMKDVRIYKKDLIHTFTRPQGQMAGLGKIGYCQFNDLANLDASVIAKASLLKNNFGDDQWGGVNQVHLLKNNRLGILGHISRMSNGHVRHYYGMTFCFNPKDMTMTGLKIICERKDFPKSKSKRADLVDVIFPGGIVRKPNGLAEIYVGLSDAAAGVALIEDPFIEYENL